MKIVNDPLKNGTKRCTSDYKTRNPKRPKHNGMDLISNSSLNNYIVAIDFGTVIATRYDSSAGYYVKVRHENKYVSVYYHMLKDSIPVKKGTKVNKGDRLGTMGSTGQATGPHLHFGLMNDKGKWIDPLPLLEGRISLHKEFPLGTYELLKEKYIRTSPRVADNKVKYSSIMGTIKPKCKADKKGYAKYKIGSTVNITAIVQDSKGNIWGKTKNTYFCMKDSTGLQVKEI